MKGVREHQVSNVKHYTNKYMFDTNFEKERVVVTRLAYAKGFTLKMKDAEGKIKKVEVFNGQGGFVSFLSGVGECSYTLEFYTPNLQLGSYVSGVALIGFISSLSIYYYFGIFKNKEKEVLELLKLSL